MRLGAVARCSRRRPPWGGTSHPYIGRRARTQLECPIPTAPPGAPIRPPPPTSPSTWTRPHYYPRRQMLVEIMSGHGNSEEFRSFREPDVAADGTRSCPEPKPDYLPCGRQAGEIMRSRCGDLPAAECERRVEEARHLAAQAWTRPQQVFPDATESDWLDCDQCHDCFKRSYGYRPRESVQYAMALSLPGAGGGSHTAALPLRLRRVQRQPHGASGQRLQAGGARHDDRRGGQPGLALSSRAGRGSRGPRRRSAGRRRLPPRPLRRPRA